MQTSTNVKPYRLFFTQLVTHRKSSGLCTFRQLMSQSNSMPVSAEEVHRRPLQAASVPTQSCPMEHLKRTVFIHENYSPDQEEDLRV